MQERVLRALRESRSTIVTRWTALLRAQPVTSPLAHPDTLVYLMDWTLDRIEWALIHSPARRRGGFQADELAAAEACACGMNPLLAYFQTAGQAMWESVLPRLEPRERDACLAALKLVVQIVAQREIQTFCAVCQRRSAGCAAASTGSAR